MGYLSQKKHQIRENLFLNVSSVVLALFTLFSLMAINPDVVFPNLFHLYLLSFLMIGYSFFVKKYKISLIFVMLFIINYTALSASGNIFISDSYEGDRKIKLTFDSTSDVIGNFNDVETSSGFLILSDNSIVPYVKILGDKPMIIIKLDLSKIKTKKREKILKQLQTFVIKQDNPVILFGDFGVPSWNRNLRRFITQTRLSVKNKILFTKNFSYNIFSMPSFYVLGFNDMGIDNIKITDSAKEKRIEFDISF